MGEGGKNASASARREMQQPREPRDYLHLHSRKAVALLAIVAIVLLVASMRSAHAKSGLPEIAFGWEFGLDVIRAAIVFAVVASILMVLVRGWGGIWPQRISTSGIDYPQLAEANRVLGREEARMPKLEAELEAAQQSEKGVPE
jgi:hypothetical protein